jgi:hypothetical protein
MKNLVKTLALGSVFGLSLAVLANEPAVAPKAEAPKTEAAPVAATPAAAPAKKLSKKEATKECKKAHLKGEELEKCIHEKTQG